jgi:hypothetical protein
MRILKPSADWADMSFFQITGARQIERRKIKEANFNKVMFEISNNNSRTHQPKVPSHSDPSQINEDRIVQHVHIDLMTVNQIVRKFTHTRHGSEKM